MRPIIIKDKYICKENIESYKYFTIEDSYFIKEENDGFKIDGKIKLRGIVVYKDDEEKLQEIRNKVIALTSKFPLDSLK